MKKLILVAICLNISFILLGQDNSFIKIFDNGKWGYEFVGQLNQSTSDDILLLSTARLSNDFGSAFRLKKLELDGNGETILFQNNHIGYSIDNGVVFNQSIYSIGTLASGIGTDNYNLLLSKINNTGLLFEYEYGIENNFERGYGVDIDPNGDIIGCGLVSRFQGSVTNESIVVKIDTLGNEIWTKRIRARYSELKARAVTTDNEGNIYVLADEESLWPSVQQVALIKLTTDGDSLWTKYYPASASLAKDVQYNNDGNLIASVTGDYDGKGRSFTMMELDTSGTILWTKSYVDELGVKPFAERFIQLRNGGYAVCLNINYPVLLVLDDKGEVINEQHYEGYGVSNVKDLIELEDGSFAIAGNITEVNQEIPKVMWLIKTNSKGELITSTIEEEYPEFTLYPNPTTGQVKIEGIDYKNGMILNQRGQIMDRFKYIESIDISNYISGIFYLVISTEKGTYTHRIIKE